MLKSNKIKWKREQKKAVFSKKYIFPHNKQLVLIHTKKISKTADSTLKINKSFTW